MNETRAVKDLSIGDRIQVKGFDDPLVVRSAKKIQKGPDAGKLDVKLAAADGCIETVRFDLEEQVAVVGKDADRGQATQKPAGKTKSKGTGKGKAAKGKGKAKTPEVPVEESTSAEVPQVDEPAIEAAATDAAEVRATQAEAPQGEMTAAEAPHSETSVAGASQAIEGTPDSAAREAAPAEATPPVEPASTDTPTAEPTPQGAETAPEQGTEARPDANGPPAKLSAIDAAAKVLGETGQPMNCQELIGAMAAKGYWTSPRGKTPSATLYSAILRELQTKGDTARFVKAARGKFAIRQLQG
jgi:hypothetical protein